MVGHWLGCLVVSVVAALVDWLVGWLVGWLAISRSVTESNPVDV